MKLRNLGTTGERVSAIGLGCMGMSEVYGIPDDAESIETLYRALDLGVNFWDTSDLYGDGANETLLSKVISSHRDEVFIATKFGFRKKGGEVCFDNSPQWIKQAVEASLHRLSISTIDLYYAHRLDPATPVEETIEAMAQLVKEGKVRYLGICEVDAETIRRAHAVHPIAALQSEYSLLSRDVEDEILPTLRELGISLVPYAPLSRGLMTNTLQEDKLSKLPGDRRASMPRFHGEHYLNNMKLSSEFAKLATQKGVTPAQLAIAWVMAQGEDIIAIPGTKRSTYLEENAAAVNVTLSLEEQQEIEKLTVRYPDIGPRY